MKLAKFNIFRLPNKYKRFDYVPRHFDQEHEDFEKRRKQLEAAREIGVDQGSGKSISFRSPLRDSRTDYKAQALRSNLRIVLILGVLFMLGYYLFQRYDILGALIGTPAN
jgi:hypothetical protein